MFKNFDDALEYFFRGNTNYEREHGIKNIECKIILKTDDVGIAQRKSEDGEITLAIIMKLSTKSDSWIFWVMSHNQMEVFRFIIPAIIDYIEKHTAIYGKSLYTEKCKD